MLVHTIDVEHKSDAIIVGVITSKAREIIAYGKFDKDDPRVPDGNTEFKIGSITKVFTSLLLADMVVNGEVKLSDPISRYLPASVHVPARHGKQITLLDLATHHSGLPNMSTNFHPDYKTEELYDFLSKYSLERDPGEKYEYSNIGVALLGDVLALRAGSDYGALLRTRIIAPLKMNDTGLHLTAEMKAHLIPGHNLRLEKRSEWDDVALEPAGGIYSTVDDLLIFLAANMGLTKSPLQPAMKEMVRVRRSAGNGVDVGLGWHILTGYNELIFHNGLTNGYFTLIGFEPHRKVGIVVLSNANVPNDLGRRILDYPGSRPVEENIGPPNLPH